MNFFFSQKGGIIDLLPQACPLLGTEPATRAGALNGHQTMTSWLIDAQPLNQK